MSSSSLRWSRVEAIEKVQSKSCLRLRKEARSEREDEQRNGRRLALLTTFMAIFVRRKRHVGGDGGGLGRRKRRHQSACWKGLGEEGNEGSTCAARCGEGSERNPCRRKIECGDGEAMQASLLMAWDADNSLGGERRVR